MQISCIGYLTEKGVRKRKREVELKLLELDFKEGELTEKCYKRKKERLEHSEDVGGHAKSVSQSLSSLPSQSKKCLTPLCRFLRTVLPHHVHEAVVVRKVEVKVLLKKPQRKVEMVILLNEQCRKVGKRS